MQIARPTTLIDPVCGMTVEVTAAESAGLLVEYKDRTYGFCRSGCRRAFVDEPEVFVARAEAAANLPAATGATEGHGSRVIDDGMRRWYESCSCCLSDAYPDIKAALDAERAAGAMAPVAPGICDVAENQVARP